MKNIKLSSIVSRAWAYLTVQGILIVALLIISNDLGPTFSKQVALGKIMVWLGILGVVLSAITIRSSLTALPLPLAHGKLGTNGLYHFVRHPIYTSVMLLAFGVALGSGSLLKYILATSLAILFYYKSIFEESFLLNKYPEYKKYSSSTPRFIPFIKK